MKKLILFLMLLLSFGYGTLNVYAADDTDLGDLDSLLGDDLGDDDTTGTDTNDGNTTQDSGSDTQDQQTVEKVKIEQTGVATNKVNLLLHPVDGYTTYKVYFQKEGTDNISEKEVTYSGAGVTSVELTGLEPGSKYIVTAKAFDDEGNPVENTTSDSITVETKKASDENAGDKTHSAASDNVIYNPTIKTEQGKIIVTYKPGVDVEKIQISMSEDGKVFKPVAVVNSTVTSYTIKTDKPGEKFIKLVPVAKDGSLGVCKIGTTNVDFVKANVTTPEQTTAQNNIGKQKTGPELYFLIILAIFAYVVYASRKIKS